MAKSSCKYVDGFVLVVPKKNLAAYKKLAKDAGKIWMKHGALSYKECIGDDLSPDVGDCVHFPFQKLTKLKRNETVWYSYIEYKSKAHRDRVNAKVMKEFEEKNKDNPDCMKDMPFDMKRMSFGGFKVEVGF